MLLSLYHGRVALQPDIKLADPSIAPCLEGHQAGALREAQVVASDVLPSLGKGITEVNGYCNQVVAMSGRLEQLAQQIDGGDRSQAQVFADGLTGLQKFAGRNKVSAENAAAALQAVEQEISGTAKDLDDDVQELNKLLKGQVTKLQNDVDEILTGIAEDNKTIALGATKAIKPILTWVINVFKEESKQLKKKKKKGKTGASSDDDSADGDTSTSSTTPATGKEKEKEDEVEDDEDGGADEEEVEIEVDRGEYVETGLATLDVVRDVTAEQTQALKDIDVKLRRYKALLIALESEKARATALIVFNKYVKLLAGEVRDSIGSLGRVADAWSEIATKLDGTAAEVRSGGVPKQPLAPSLKSALPLWDGLKQQVSSLSANGMVSRFTGRLVR